MTGQGLMEFLQSLIRRILHDEMPNKLSAVFEELRQVRYALYHDPLTGLPNELALRRAQERQRIDWYVVADLDGFKDYQDGRQSHAAGDRILREFSDWIRKNIRQHPGRGKDGAHKGVRLHGDEFVICCTRSLGALRICGAIRGWRSEDGGVTASAGWGRTLEDADREMYQWKTKKKATGTCASSS